MSALCSAAGNTAKGMTMCVGMLTFRKLWNLVVPGLLVVSSCYGVEAFAQMQIPNPLIRPRGLTNPVIGDIPALPGNAGSSPRNTALTADRIIPLPPNANDDPLVRELNEQKERFAGFYVSAIVDKQAVLRRSAIPRIPTAVPASPAIGSSMAPVPLGTQIAAMTTRNDALMLTDGESFDATGNVGSLYARVSNRQVVIYHVADSSAPEPKPGKRYPIVFVGELETSGNPAQPAIVLERPDPLYKRSLSVEIKARSNATSMADIQNQQAPGATPVSSQ
jgi:hypothetical protein